MKNHALVPLAVVLLASGCSRPAEPQPEVVRPVRTVTVSDGGGKARTFSGRARAAVGMSLSFRVGGEIRELPAKIGLSVRAGDVLARLDSTDYELRVKQLEADLARAEAHLKQTRADYERTRNLYEANGASKSDLDRDRANYEAAQAQRVSAEKALDLARQQLEYCTLKAPLDGSISSVPAEIHTSVGAGMTVVGLSASRAMEVEVGLPEALIRSIRVKDRAAVVFDTLAGITFTGVVTEVGIQASEATTYPVRLTLDGQDARVLDGMVCNVTFEGDGAAELIAVPGEAVAGTPDGAHFVWVVDPDSGQVARRIVTIGSLTSAGLQIASGLAAGDVVVVRGVHLLEEGQKVRVIRD